MIPREAAAEVLEAVRARQQRERTWLEHIAQDDYSILVDTDDALRARGCRIVEES